MLVFTSCTNNYLPKARILASSLKKHHPDWIFCLLLGETPPAGFNLEREPFDRLLSFDKIGIPQFKSWLFRHRVVEICTAAKGPALHYFLTVEQHDKVMYLDPDIKVLNSLQPLSDQLDTYDVLLTPHLLHPQSTIEAVMDNEISALQHGVYNLGFVATAQREQGLAFANWWKERLLHFCYDDIPNGLFTDQRWCDLAPAFFSNLRIIRDPGYNVASWNLAERSVTQDMDGTFMVGDTPLRFYHFTGYDSGAGETMSQKYGSTMPAVAALWQSYGKDLRLFGHGHLKGAAWRYLTFDDGTRIEDDMRLLYRNRKDVQAAFPNPFTTQPNGGFLAWYQQTKFKPTTTSKWKKYRRRVKKAFVLTKIYTKTNGLRALPHLLTTVVRTLLSGGIPALKAKVRKYQADLDQQSDTPHQCCKTTTNYTSVSELLNSLECNLPITLILTIPWEGGATDYLAKAINTLPHEKPKLVLTWDKKTQKISGQLLHKHFLAEVTFSDLSEIQKDKELSFDSIWINNLNGWSVTNHKRRSLCFLRAVPLLLEKILSFASAHSCTIRVFFHDHLAVCPNWSLFDSNGKYCGVRTDQLTCQQCLAQITGEDTADFSIATWRESWNNLFAATAEIRFFSKASKDIASKVFNLPQERTTIVPHTPLIKWESTYDVPQNMPMTIGVVGNIYGDPKGLSILQALTKLLSADERLVVIGTVAGQLPEQVSITGSYEREELPQILRENNITVGFLSSVVPETFSYVTQECMSLMLPMVAFPLGAQGERIGAWEHGLLASEITPEAALSALRILHARYQSGDWSDEVRVMTAG